MADLDELELNNKKTKNNRLLRSSLEFESAKSEELKELANKNKLNQSFSEFTHYKHPTKEIPKKKISFFNRIIQKTVSFFKNIDKSLMNLFIVNKIWKGIKTTFRLAFSNTVSLTAAAASFGIAIITGGTAPVVIGAVILAVKTSYVVAETYQRRKERILDKQNSAIVDFMSAQAQQRELLNIIPKLKLIPKYKNYEGAGRTEKTDLENQK